MKKLYPYNKFISEGVRDKMTPVPKETVDNLIDKYIKNYPTLHSALMKAIEDDKVDIAEMIIKRGADVNDYNEEALRIAAKFEYSDIVIMLLQNGAKPKDAIEYHKEIYGDKYEHVIDEIRFYRSYAYQGSIDESVKDKMTPKSSSEIDSAYENTAKTVARILTKEYSFDDFKKAYDWAHKHKNQIIALLDDKEQQYDLDEIVQSILIRENWVEGDKELVDFIDLITNILLDRGDFDDYFKASEVLWNSREYIIDKKDDGYSPEEIANKFSKHR